MSDSCRWSGSVSLLDQQYEFAFIGKIEKRLSDYSLSLDKFSVNVISSYKGDVSENVIVWSGDSSDCGADFVLGKTYVIFAKKIRNKLIAHYPSVWEFTEENKNVTDNFLKYYEKKNVTKDDQ